MTSIHHHFPANNMVRSQAIGNRKRDPLPCLLMQLVARAGLAMVVSATSRPWCSALFQGRRHVILLRIEGDDAEMRQARFMNGLAEVEWTLPGHFVADICVDDSVRDDEAMVLTLSALTIEDW